MNKIVSILIVMLLIGGLVLVRIFEGRLFYDPLLEFFITDHATSQLPSLEMGRLIVHTTFRFVLNTVLSLGIIWFLFRDKGFLKLSMVLYSILFVLLIGLFTVLIMTSESTSHMTLFYVRRFLIQPLFLLILVPAFYFQKRRA